MRVSIRTILLVLAPLGCGERPFNFEETDSATSTTSTSQTTSGTTGTTAVQTTGTSAGPTGTSEPPGSSGAPESTGSIFIPIPDAPEPGCDVWAEDCPEGQKCMPVSLDGDNAWESLRCVPIAPGPGQIGDPCTNLGTGVDGLDTCGLHMMCWYVDPDTKTGTCLGMCTGSPENPLCPDQDTVCTTGGDSVLNLCIPTCDPLAQDCPDATLCVPAFGDAFTCVPDADDGPSPAFAPCEWLNACDPGLVCIPPEYAVECDPMASGCCLPYCDLSQPNTCPGQGQECVPWFQDAPPPPKYANVGACGIPMP